MSRWIGVEGIAQQSECRSHLHTSSWVRPGSSLRRIGYPCRA